MQEIAPGTLPQGSPTPLRRAGQMLADDEGTDDEPTSPVLASGARPVQRIDNLARRAPGRPPPVAPAPSPIASGGTGATGFALLPHEDDTTADRPEPPPSRAPGRPPARESAGRIWADESLFDEPSPQQPAPASPPRRPALSVLPGRDAPRAESPRPEPSRPSSLGFQLVQDDDAAVPIIPPSSGPAVFIDDGGGGRRGQQSATQPIRPPRANGEPAEERAGPLRVFLGSAGAEGPGTRKQPPADVSGPIWDATAVVFRRYDTDDMLARTPEDITEEAEPAEEQRSPGQLPRTWLDPTRLPPGLDKSQGSRPRRVGGVVQPVPGTPSALAIAREEAEASRLGPPPPLVSPPPLIMSSGWATPDLDPPQAQSPPEPIGFQLGGEQDHTPTRESPSLVVGDAPPVPRRAPQATPASGGTLRLYATVGFLVIVLVGAAGIYLFRDRQIAPPRTPAPEQATPDQVSPAPVQPEQAPATAPSTQDGAPAVSAPPPTEVAAPVATPIVQTRPAQANPCDAPTGTEFTGQLTVASSARGTIFVDSKRCGPLPLAEPIRLTQGTHLVQIRGGKNASQTVRVDAERMTKVEF